MTNGPITALTSNKTAKAYTMQGWNAAMAGFKVSDCPYYASSAAEKAWLKGFNS